MEWWAGDSGVDRWRDEEPDSPDNFEERLLAAKSRLRPTPYGWPYEVVATLPDKPIESVLAPIVEEPTPIEADEQTIRAREAVIATGFFPGAEQVIRSGQIDHIHGLQTALEVQRSLSIPVEQLHRQQVVPYKRADNTLEMIFPSRWAVFLRWCSRVRRQFVHAMIRRNRLLARVEKAEALLAVAEHTTKTLQAEIEERKKGKWVDGRKSIPVTGTVFMTASTNRYLNIYTGSDEANQALPLGCLVPLQCDSCGAGLGHHSADGALRVRCHSCGIDIVRAPVRETPIEKGIRETEAELEKHKLLAHKLSVDKAAKEAMLDYKLKQIEADMLRKVNAATKRPTPPPLRMVRG